MNISLRRSIGLLLTSFVAVLAILGSAGSAHAADGYRYWNYFHLENGQWSFSQVGASDFTPEDGALEGYRYGTSSTADGIAPRADLTEVNFESICAGTKADAGKKRVALVIDYGIAADADGATPPSPRAECVVADTKANGQQVLESATKVRSEKSLTCALDGYPVKGCGVPVADAAAPSAEDPVTFEMPSSEAAADGTEPSASGQDDDGGTPWPLIGVGAAVIVIGGGGFALSRRNKAA